MQYTTYLKPKFIVIVIAIAVVATVALVRLWASQSGSGDDFYAQVANIPGVEVDDNNETSIFPLSNLSLVDQERQFDLFLLALNERADATGDARLSEDVMTCIRMISSGDVASFLAECSSLGVVPFSGITPDRPLWRTRFERYRNFILRLRFHHDEIVIREDSGNFREARDPQGESPDVVNRYRAHHPFVERIPTHERRHVEVLLPFTYLSVATSTDTYGCLGLVMIWNTEVSRWVMVEYRNYQDPGKQPVNFPSPIF